MKEEEGYMVAGEARTGRRKNNHIGAGQPGIGKGLPHRCLQVESGGSRNNRGFSSYTSSPPAPGPRPLSMGDSTYNR